MVSHDMHLRIHAVRFNSIGSVQCDPCLGLRGASFTDDLLFLTCADLLLIWQECVILPIETLILTADILQMQGWRVRRLCPNPDPIPVLRM